MDLRRKDLVKNNRLRKLNNLKMIYKLLSKIYHVNNLKLNIEKTVIIPFEASMKVQLLENIF